MTTPTRAIDSAVVCSSRAHLSSLVGMPLLVKVVMPEETFVVISRVVPLAVQTLESVRTRYTSSHLPRRVRLGIGLATPSQQSVVLNSMRTTTFLTFSVLSVTSICWVTPVPAIATLGYSRVHSSPSDCSCVMPKVKWAVNEGLTFGTLLRWSMLYLTASNWSHLAIIFLISLPRVLSRTIGLNALKVS